ncbi:unnamed protein product [Aspergillus oryzae]|nr:unnamed protein product [Aspergillus oryzae]GMF91500.1 unnamed protein product [Aspergillus oryzae]
MKRNNGRTNSPGSSPAIPSVKSSWDTIEVTDKYVSKVKEDLYKFQGLQPDDPEFIPTLKTLWANLAQHIKEEETQDLPALEHALSDSDSDSMARSFGRTKKFIPTRSHPAAPDKPPYETVAGLMSAPMDRLGDLLRKFPDEARS